MSAKTASFEAVCPHCGQAVTARASETDVAGGSVAVQETCQRCLGAFEAIAEVDCLEWDDQCTVEMRRLG
jgi:hypothetical protein